MFKIDGYEPGVDITICNVLYRHPIRNEETGQREPDFLIVIFRDNVTGEKKSYTVMEPEYTWYLAKPGVRVGPDDHFIAIDDAIPITCKYNDILKSIAYHTGEMETFNENIRNGEYRLNRTFLTHPRSFGADINIKNYVRCEFSNTYKNTINMPTIFFWDSEAEILNAVSDNISFGECPTSLLSGYFTGNKTMYTLVLRYPDNPLVGKFEQEIREMGEKGIQEMYHEALLEQLKTEERINEFGLDGSRLNIAFFDTEMEMIATFFQIIRDLQPDYCTAWNLFGYDALQIDGRIRHHGYSPADIVCDPRVQPKLYELFTDEKNWNKPEERTDHLDVSMMSVWIDQEILYASRRKGQAAIPSYALDSIAEKEADVHKKDYHMITTNIARFPWLDFKSFTIYNIEDVIAQVCIEVKTQDFAYMHNNVLEMRTTHEKIFRQTVFLAVKAYDFYKTNEGLIMGNNHNKILGTPESGFSGAYVARPDLLSDKNKVKCNGRPIMKINNSCDYDYTALYPSLIRESNMAPNTQVGLISFDDDDPETRPKGTDPETITNHAPFKDPALLSMPPGGTFIENLASYNFVEFAHRWMMLGNVDEVLEDMDEYFSKYRTPLCRQRDPYYKQLPLDQSNQVVAYHHDKSRIVRFTPKMPDWVKERIDRYRSTIPLV